MRLILLILLSVCYADVIYVPADYSTIQEGIDVSINGDSILVSTGTYYEIINFNGKNIIITSVAGPEGTIIDAYGAGPAIIFENGENGPVELSGFTIQNAGTYANGGAIYIYGSSPNFKNLIIQDNAAFNMGGGIYINGGSQTFTNCKIYNNEVGDTNGGGMYCINSEYLYIDNCEFKFNHSPKNGGGIYLNNSYVEIKNTKIIENNEGIGGNNPMPTPKGGGIYAYSSEVHLYNNVISSNNSYGPGGGIYGFESEFEIYNTEICNNTSLNYWQQAEGGGASFYNSTVSLNQVTLSGNIAYSLQQYNSDGLLLKGSTTAHIFNSIIYDNDDSEIKLDGSACVTLDYTDIMGGILGISGPSMSCCEYGTNNIDENPLFIDPENQDFTLQYNSPCIDTGTADLDGDGIDDIIDYYGLAPDMGAYEYESEYDFNLGDVNFDNEINILDVVLMVSFILGEPTDEYEYSAADINQDGLLNILDIVALVNIILGN